MINIIHCDDHFHVMDLYDRGDYIEVSDFVDEYVAEYFGGLAEPNFPMPDVPLHVVLHSDDYMYDTVYIETADDIEDPIIVALWDFNFDRCIAFGTPYGGYQGFKTPTISRDM